MVRHDRAVSPTVPRAVNQAFSAANNAFDDVSGLKVLQSPTGSLAEKSRRWIYPKPSKYWDFLVCLLRFTATRFHLGSSILRK
jgi:hypothetical protein